MGNVSLTDRVLKPAATVVVVALCFFVPSTPLAQSDDEKPESASVPDRSSSNDSSFLKPPLELFAGGEKFRIRRPETTDKNEPAPGASRLVVERDGPSDPPVVARIELPEWLREGHVEVAAKSATISTERAAVILTVSPVSGGAAARRLQVAYDFAVSRPADWRRIDATEVSQLDAGYALSLRRPADSRQEQAASNAQLLRENRRLEEMFCGHPAHSSLGQQVWDPTEGKFDPPRTDSLTDKARNITAHLPETPLAGPFTRGAYQWFWTGDVTDASPQRRRFRPTMLGDRKPSTFWEASPWIRRSDSALQGAAFASARVTDAAAVDSIRIVPGDADAPEPYRASKKPAAMLLTFSGGETFIANLPEMSFETLASRGGLVIELPEPIRTRCLTAAPIVDDPEIGSVEISEITPVLTIDGDSKESTANHIIDAILEAKRPGRRRELTNLGLSVSPTFGGHIETRLQGLIETSRTEAKNEAEDSKADNRRDEREQLARLVSVLGRLESGRALPILTDLFIETKDQPAHSPLRQSIRRALASHRDGAADALMAMLDDESLDEASRLMTLRLLNRVARAEHRLALVENLGRGSREIREERIRTISAAGAQVLDPVLSVVAAWPTTNAGRDALRVASRIGRRPEAKPPISNEQPGAIASRLESGESRRTLLLALQAAAVVETESIVEHARDLHAHEHPLVRREAVRSLAHYAGESSRKLLLTGLEDRSPDVRIAAVNTISKRPDRQHTVDGLMAYARTESWRAGRTQAVRVLAEIKNPKTTDFFAQLLRPDSGSNESVELKEIAAAALLRAGRTLNAEICIALLRSEEQSSDSLRLRSIDLLGLDDSSNGLEVLLALAKGKDGVIPKAAAEESHRQALKQRALLSLGRRRSAEGRSLLETLAFDDEKADISVRRHAIRALGFYDDTELVRRLRGLLATAEPALKPAIRQTIAMLENRRTLDDLTQRIDAIRQSEPSETSEDAK